MKIDKKIERESSHQTAFRNSAPCHKDARWLHHKCYVAEKKVFKSVHLSYVQWLSSADESLKD